MSTDEQPAHGVCSECDEPIRDLSQRTAVAEHFPNREDRDDPGGIAVAHVGCVE